MDSKKIELCVSAERNMLLIIRMTTAGVVSRAGLTLDEMDDVKMAIDEACNMMMLQKPGCSTLKLVYEFNEEQVCVRIEGQGEAENAEESQVDMNMQEVIRCILESMVDEVEVMARADGATKAVLLKKNIPDRRRSAV